MPAPLEIVDCIDPVVVWPATGRVDQYGQPLVGSPVQVYGRWVIKQTTGKDKDGNNITLDGQLACSARLSVGSRAWEGTLTEWNALGGSTADQGVMYLASENKARPVKGDGARRYEYGLTRFQQVPGV